MGSWKGLVPFPRLPWAAGLLLWAGLAAAADRGGQCHGLTLDPGPGMASSTELVCTAAGAEQSLAGDPIDPPLGAWSGSGAGMTVEIDVCEDKIFARGTIVCQGNDPAQLQFESTALPPYGDPVNFMSFQETFSCDRCPPCFAAMICLPCDQSQSATVDGTFFDEFTLMGSWAFTQACLQADCQDRSWSASPSARQELDSDNDGAPTCSDCDPTNSFVFPGAEEFCDGADNDCDGIVDEGCTTDVATALCGDTAHYAWVERDPSTGDADIKYRNCTVGGSCNGIKPVVGSTSDELNPAIACSGSTVLIAWEEYRDVLPDIAVSRSTDGGGGFSGRTVLAGGSAAESAPALAMTGDVAMLVWVDTRLGDEDIAFRRSTNGGMDWDPRGFLVRSPHDETAPDIALDGDLGLLAWEDRRHGNRDIAIRRSSTMGASWDPLQFVVRNGAQESDPTVALDNGTLTALVGWTDRRKGNQDPAYRRSTDGGGVFGSLRFLAGSTAEDIQPVLRLDGMKGLFAWVDARDANANMNISFRHSTDGGDSWGNPGRLVSSMSADEFGPACDIIGDTATCAWSDTRTGAVRPAASDTVDGTASWSAWRRLDQ